jgi:hypothetical protein
MKDEKGFSFEFTFWRRTIIWHLIRVKIYVQANFKRNRFTTVSQCHLLIQNISNTAFTGSMIYKLEVHLYNHHLSRTIYQISLSFRHQNSEVQQRHFTKMTLAKRLQWSNKSIIHDWLFMKMPNVILYDIFHNRIPISVLDSNYIPLIKKKEKNKSIR